ncbi:hypothetical protein EI555_008829, partial [Monodon monoceros]
GLLKVLCSDSYVKLSQYWDQHFWKTGFCFVEYYSRPDAENATRYINGTCPDDRIIRTDWGAGFKEGRQYGRGCSGGQVRDEYRQDYDAGRGGYGKLAQNQSLMEQSEELGDKDGSKVTTVVATPGQGPDRPQEVSYTDTKVIGNGSFGVVYQAKLCDSGELVAIKKVLQDKRFKNRELQIMRKLDHCNIVRLRYFFYSSGEKIQSSFTGL